jgi:hypothetical protein
MRDFLAKLEPLGALDIELLFEPIFLLSFKFKGIFMNQQIK